ncbi:hypothetical protein GA0061098_104624 [Bradyrhizobium shewense]|uniref:Uncharacterized protein n=1 Tax=Bradyrhizobium shewense TaxID=1761772 RepID=A0A1C3XTJ2_9BRAD|nr:hypothetical protein GA0061098_104624 [Bradyrhizobium shewense]
MHSFLTLRPTALQEMPKSVIRRPLGASQMAFKSTAGAIRIKGGINTKHNARNFAPISVIGFGIQETHIDDSMLLVIRRELGRVRRGICDLGIGWHCLKVLSD